MAIPYRPLSDEQQFRLTPAQRRAALRALATLHDRHLAEALYARVEPTTALEAEVLAKHCEDVASRHTDGSTASSYQRHGEGFRDQARRLRAQVRRLKDQADELVGVGGRQEVREV